MRIGCTPLRCRRNEVYDTEAAHENAAAQMSIFTAKMVKHNLVFAIKIARKKQYCQDSRYQHFRALDSVQFARHQKNNRHKCNCYVLMHIFLLLMHSTNIVRFNLFAATSVRADDA